jgi:protein-disulfide isomerase
MIQWQILKGAVPLFIMTLAVAINAATPSANWLLTFSETPSGSFVMGNPAAPIKLTEYASYTCGHCADFEVIEAPKVKSQNIASGKVSFEVRNLVRDQYDLTLAMLARCGGKGRFFGNHNFLMANQQAILANTTKISAATAQKLTNNDYAGYMVGAYVDMGLGTFMAKRAITDVQAKACLADNAALKKILAMTQLASSKYAINATPTFLVDDKVASDAHNFATIQPYLTAK